MSLKRVNVLVYAGGGSTTSSVRHAVWSLRRLLGPNYAVLTVTGDQILKEPWMPSCALLVMPGGADLGYARTLNGEGNRRIKLYVQNGGKYLGLCAGGYYGCARCEWEVGKKGIVPIAPHLIDMPVNVNQILPVKGFEHDVSLFCIYQRAYVLLRRRRDGKSMAHLRHTLAANSSHTEDAVLPP